MRGMIAIAPDFDETSVEVIATMEEGAEQK